MNADVLVLGGAWLTGLMGSAHCAAMCGGIATGFSLPRGRGSWLDALEPNVGRVTGYVIGGAVAGGIGGGVTAILPFEALTRISRAAVGLVLVIAALRLLDRRGRLRFLEAPARAGWRWLAPLQRRCLPTDRGARRMLAGMVWGWLPCGLSTTVLVAVWLQGDAVQGAMTMLAFGAGTLPAMLPLTWSGARLGQSLRSRGLRTAAASMVLLAGLVTMAAPWLAHLPLAHSALTALGCRSVS
jgi:sulfite exporter TauE/SafE